MHPSDWAVESNLIDTELTPTCCAQEPSKSWVTVVAFVLSDCDTLLVGIILNDYNCWWQSSAQGG